MNIFRLWAALLYKRMFYPRSSIWVRANGEWHNLENWDEVRPFGTQTGE